MAKDLKFAIDRSYSYFILINLDIPFPFSRPVRSVDIFTENTEKMNNKNFNIFNPRLFFKSVLWSEILIHSTSLVNHSTRSCCFD